MIQKVKYTFFKHTFLLFAALILFAALSGCKRDAPKKLIRFGYIAADQLHSPAVMVMKEKKLREAAGFAVEWSEYLAGAHAVQELSLDAIDFASCGVFPVMVSHSQGVVPLAILAGANEEGSSLVVDNSITALGELDGKRIATPGIGSIQDALIAQLAMTNNIRINRVTMDVSDMPLFLHRKEIDGFIAWAPHPARAVDQKYGHELLTSHSMMPGHQCCVLVTKESTMQDDPETVNKLLKVYLDAYEWFLGNQDESIKLMAKNTGMPESVVRHALDTVRYNYPPYCNMASIQSIAHSLIETGRIATKEEDMVPFIKSLYHPQLLENISGTKQPNL
jgi:NitT/TauT family transport system substrate-binding protein